MGLSSGAHFVGCPVNVPLTTRIPFPNPLPVFPALPESGTCPGSLAQSPGNLVQGQDSCRTAGLMAFAFPQTPDSTTLCALLRTLHPCNYSTPPAATDPIHPGVTPAVLNCCKLAAHGTTVTNSRVRWKAFLSQGGRL